MAARSGHHRDGRNGDAVTPKPAAYGRDDGLADVIADRLDVPVTAAGVVFLLLVLAETVSSPDGAIGTAFTVVGWSLWALFVLEFVVRLIVAPSATGFLRRNWWQLAFLAVPALRFVRALRALRAARVGRVLSAAIRSGRSAGRKLTSRAATLATVTVIVVLTASQVLYELDQDATYGDVLHAVALATVAGEPLPNTDGVGRVVGLLLVAYSMVVFAALAGTVGAYVLERDRRTDSEP